MLQENPHTTRGSIYDRYESYKSATTIKELRDRGISSYDLGQYFDKGYITVVTVQAINLPTRNPYRVGGDRYVRYEVYKTATTMQELKDKGAMYEDMSDLRKKGLIPT
jgi:hypothetical protein